LHGSPVNPDKSVVPLSGGKMIGIYHQPGQYFRTESYQNPKNAEQAQNFVIVK
jgi:hypothetical protein